MVGAGIYTHTLSVPPRNSQRSILVDKSELGYPQGINELPPDTPFELRVEVLSVFSK